MFHSPITYLYSNVFIILTRIFCLNYLYVFNFFSDGSRNERAVAPLEDGEYVQLSLLKQSFNRSSGNDTFMSEPNEPPLTPTLWKKSEGSIANYIESKRIDGIKERQENEEAVKDLNTMWDSTLTAQVNDSYCNLTNEFFTFVAQPSIHIPLSPVLPQSIAVDGNCVYLGCVINSAVYFFHDGYFRGI